VAHLGDERRSPLVESLNNSLIIAAFTTIFSVMLGTAGAWLLYRFRYPALRSISTLIFLPMIIPEIIMGISLLIFFKTIDLELGFTTVIISHVTFCFPFVLIAVQARLAGVDPALEEAAMDLGATPLKAFFLIMVPYLLPAIISGALMSFTLSLDELIVTYFTRGPKSETLPIKVFGMAKVGLNPILNTISTVFIVLTAMLVVTAESLKKVNR
jgi:spermidine/putrescine transport system permease protein